MYRPTPSFKMDLLSKNLFFAQNLQILCVLHTPLTITVCLGIAIRKMWDSVEWCGLEQVVHLLSKCRGYLEVVVVYMLSKCRGYIDSVSGFSSIKCSGYIDSSARM